jgi:hypothetical protein
MLFFKLVATDKGGVMQLRIKTTNEDGCEVEEVWLLKSGLSSLLYCAHDCPESLRREIDAALRQERAETNLLFGIYGEEEKSVPGDGDEESCGFVRVMDSEAIIWLNENVNWMLDFTELISSDVATLEEMRRAIREQTDATRSSVRYWRAMGNVSEEPMIECARLKYADASITLVLKLLTGKLRLRFPDDYEGPTSFGLWNKTVEYVERLLTRASECIKRLVANAA